MNKKVEKQIPFAILHIIILPLLILYDIYGIIFGPPFFVLLILSIIFCGNWP